MNEVVWLAKQGWVDWMENHWSNAFGYRTVGFFSDEAIGQAWVDKEGEFTQEDCYAIPKEGAPKRMLERLEKMEPGF